MKSGVFFKNSFWVIGSKISQSILIAIVGIFITRNLNPLDFAIFASIHVIVSILTVITNLGFSFIVIQSENIYNKIPSIFLFQILTSFSLYIFSILLIRPIVSEFYKIPEINNYYFLYSTTLILLSISSIPKALLNKKENFKFLSIIESVIIVIGSILSVLLIIFEFEIYALLIPPIVREIILSLVLIYKTKNWLFGKLEPLKISISNFYLVSAQFINSLILNIETYSLGALFSVETLGFFNRARSLENLFSSNVAISIGSVAFPHLAKIKNDFEIENSLKKIIASVSSISFPILFICSYLSEEIVFILLGETWLTSGYFLKFLCISAVPIPIYHVLSGFLLSKGFFDKTIKISLMNLIISSIVFFVIPYFFEINGVLVGIIFLQFFQLFCFGFFTHRVLPFKSTSFFKLIIRKLISPSLSIIILHFIYLLFGSWSPISTLIFSIPFYLVNLILFTFIFDNEFFEEIKLKLFESINKKN